MTNTGTPAPAAPAYTDAEALDESVLMMLRKARRVGVLDQVRALLGDDVWDTLCAAETRADALRFADERRGIPLCSRPFPVADEDEDA